MDPLVRRRPLDEFRTSPLLFLARRVYAWTQLAVPVPPTYQFPTDVRIICISDTHGAHAAQPPLPASDMLLHAGNLTQSGTLPELCDALAWLSAQSHPIKVVIAGNHDAALADPETRAYVRRVYPELAYLENEVAQVTVRGHPLRIYGSPYTPQHGDPARPFHYLRFHPSDHPRFSGTLSPSLTGIDADQPSVALWAGVPPRIDVLLTHGLPLGHLDRGAGCVVLLSALWRVRPRVHVFGHIHAGRGVERVTWDDVQPAFGAVCVSADASAAGAKWIAFVRLVWRALTAKLSVWWWGRRARLMWGRETVLVNAASAGDGPGGPEDAHERRGAVMVDVDLAS